MSVPTRTMRPTRPSLHTGRRPAAAPSSLDHPDRLRRALRQRGLPLERHLADLVAGTTQQTPFYMLMIALHLVLGFFLIVPFLIFGFVHLATSWKRPNKTAVRFGLALLGVVLVILISGLVLVRLGGFEVRDPRIRGGRLLAARTDAARWRWRSTSSTGSPGHESAGNGPDG